MSEVKPEPKKLTEEPFVRRQQAFAGIDVETCAGRMPIFDEEGEVEALMYFTSYEKVSSAPVQDRPLMFVFNGGPGSPSLWLHLGSLGPRRAKMMPDGSMPNPPYEIEDNAHHWLDLADLVFIDPIGTGWSRAKDKETSKKHWNMKGDIEAVSQFIRTYLGRFKRWGSPLYIAGESYGTLRAAGIAGHLVDRGVGFTGIILISSVLNYQSLSFHRGNDLPYPTFLPTYAATAQYHGMVKGEREEVIARAREFALGEYWTALAKGDSLADPEKSKVRESLSELTGLSESFLDGCGLRPNIMDFCKELLRSQGRTVGRLDSRIQGIDDSLLGHAQKPDHDPSMSMLMPPYVTLWNRFAREELGYETDVEYEVFGGIKEPWVYPSGRDGYPDTSEGLRKAMAKNPSTKVLVASGYYDLATPFFATEYTLNHMGLDPVHHQNITIKEYPAGHMMYIHEECLATLKQDVAEFIED